MPYYEIHHGDRLLARLESPTIDGRYHLVSTDGSLLPGLEDSNVRVPGLGSGGFGQVVRAIDRVKLPRVLKFLDPLAVLQPAPDSETLQLFTSGSPATPDDVEELSSQFQKEIEYTNARPFKNILPITDFGELIDVDGRVLRYYVSPYMQGDTLGEFLLECLRYVGGVDESRRRRCRAHLHDLALGAIDDLLAGLCELSEAGVMHMDIKPSNLMIEGHGADEMGWLDRDAMGNGRLFIIDLGAGVSLRERSEREDRIRLVTTPYFFPEHLVGALNYKPEDKCVSHKAIMQLGSTIDLYSGGRTLEYLLLDRVRRATPRFVPNERLRDSETRKELKWRDCLGDDFETVEGLVDRLLKTGNGKFGSPKEALLSFRAIQRHNSPSIFASRALTDQSPGLRIKVGRTLVRIAPPFERVVDHPVFQRLRRLQQLSLLSEVFPDATHTRFSHSLSTFDMAKRFILGLNKHVEFRLIFTQVDVEQVLAAALLHDIGQYPFSHTIEDLRKIGDLFGVTCFKEILHDQELAVQYLDREDGETASINSVLLDWGLDVDDILYMIQKTEKENSRAAAVNVGRDIVSGIIDIDRVSYLLQDSMATGVPYGSAVDVDSLIEALCIDPGGGGAVAGGGPSLGIDEGGTSAAEAILTAVYWMYRNVYWRHTNRAFMAAIKHVMATLLQSGELGFGEYAEAMYGKGDWDALVFLDRKYQLYAKHAEDPVYSPLQSLLNGRRLPYRRVFALGYEDGEGGSMYEAIINGATPELGTEIVRLIEAELPRGVSVRQGDILLDVPMKRRLRRLDAAGGFVEDTVAEGGARPTLRVRRRDRDGKTWWQELHSHSPLARSLGAMEDHSGRKIRVFLSTDLVSGLREDLVAKIGTQIYAVLSSDEVLKMARRAGACAAAAQ